MFFRALLNGLALDSRAWRLGSLQKIKDPNIGKPLGNKLDFIIAAPEATFCTFSG